MLIQSNFPNENVEILASVHSAFTKYWLLCVYILTGGEQEMRLQAVGSNVPKGRVD